MGDWRRCGKDFFENLMNRFRRDGAPTEHDSELPGPKPIGFVFEPVGIVRSLVPRVEPTHQLLAEMATIAKHIALAIPLKQQDLKCVVETGNHPPETEPALLTRAGQNPLDCQLVC